jgi:hypothetical protein
MQIKAMSCHFTLIRIAVNIRDKKITSASKDVEERGPLHTVGGDVHKYRLYGKQHGNFSKIKTRSII